MDVEVAPSRVRYYIGLPCHLYISHAWMLSLAMLGNFVMFVMYLAPLLYKNKSIKGLISVPYVSMLFGIMIWLYYDVLKRENADLLVNINSIGCLVETIYIFLFLLYARKNAKVYTVILVSLLNIGVYGAIAILILLTSKTSNRPSNHAIIVGWICVSCPVWVFLALLTRLVIWTKRIVFMSFLFSFSLAVSALVGFLYGWLSRDIYVVLPNILWCGFGVAQMVLYIIFRDARDIGFGVAQMVLYIIFRDARDIEQESKEPKDVVKYLKGSRFLGSSPQAMLETENEVVKESADGQVELSHYDIV